MPARALLVLLVMLNFGIAVWWLLRPVPPGPAPWTQPPDVPRLQLLAEASPPSGGRPSAAATAAGDATAGPAGGTGPDDAAAQPVPADGDGSVHEAPAPERPAGSPPRQTLADDAPDATDPVATGLRCTSFGPFADATSVAGARGALQPLGAVRMRVRDVVEAPRGWRVAMAPQPDRAAADSLAAQIREAGFDDLLVVPSGDEANAIALGRYGSEPAARRREASLRSAGFPAQAQPLGGAATRHWLDAAWGPGFDVAAARRAAAAPQAQDIDCATVVGTAAPR